MGFEAELGSGVVDGAFGGAEVGVGVHAVRGGAEGADGVVGGDLVALGSAVALEELLFDRAEVADVVGVAIDPGEGIVV